MFENFQGPQKPIYEKKLSKNHVFHFFLTSLNNQQNHLFSVLVEFFFFLNLKFLASFENRGMPVGMLPTGIIKPIPQNGM